MLPSPCGTSGMPRTGDAQVKISLVVFCSSAGHSFAPLQPWYQHHHMHLFTSPVKCVCTCRSLLRHERHAAAGQPSQSSCCQPPSGPCTACFDSCCTPTQCCRYQQAACEHPLQTPDQSLGSCPSGQYLHCSAAVASDRCRGSTFCFRELCAIGWQGRLLGWLKQEHHTYGEGFPYLHIMATSAMMDTTHHSR